MLCVFFEMQSRKCENVSQNGNRSLCTVNVDYVTCVCLQAIQSPGVEGVQERAWAAVVPLVAKLKTFYEFSQKLGRIMNVKNSVNRVTLSCIDWFVPKVFCSCCDT